MTLHEDKETFSDFISFTSQQLGIRELYVEKDYWVTLILKRLSNSEFKGMTIFKGGTALSKALQVIERFSEDIDLAVVTTGMKGSHIKKLVRDIEKEITTGFQEIETNQTSKGSKFRKTVYEYPKITGGGDFGQAIDKIIVELNSFTTPSPNSPQHIESYIAEYLNKNNKYELVKKYELESFSVLVLNIERTLVEKILALIRLSYNEDFINELRKKIRHVYDLERIMQVDGLIQFICSPDFFTIIDLVKKDDSLNTQFNGEWLENKLSDSPFFSDINGIWDKIEGVYNKEFKDLVYGDLPSSDSIKRKLKIILTRLVEYDKKHSKPS